MRRHRAVAAALVAIIATAVSGCSTAKNTASGDKETLTFLSPYTKDQTEPLLQAFEQSHPGKKVNASYLAKDSQQLLLTQLAAGTAPDVMYMNPGAGAPTAVGVLAKAGYLADLSDAPWASKIPDDYKPYLSHEGRVYAFPSTIFGLGGLYNMTDMRRLGLTAPDTWSAVLAFCAAAKQKGAVAYAAGAGEGWIAQLITYALVSTLVDGKDESFESGVGKGSKFAGSEWVTALRKHREMAKAGCFQSNPTGTDGPASYKLVGSGKALAVVQVSAVLADVQAQAPQGTEFQLLPLPATDNQAETHMPASLSSTMGINAKAKNPELAREFVNWMSEPAQLAKLASRQAGTLPTITAPDLTPPAVLSDFQKRAQGGRTTPIPDSVWPNPTIQATHIAGVQAMLLDKKTPEQIAAEMDTAAQG